VGESLAREAFLLSQEVASLLGVVEAGDEVGGGFHSCKEDELDRPGRERAWRCRRGAHIPERNARAARGGAAHSVLHALEQRLRLQGVADIDVTTSIDMVAASLDVERPDLSPQAAPDGGSHVNRGGPHGRTCHRRRDPGLGLFKALTESAGEFASDMGREVELKGITGAQRVHAVEWR